MSELEHQHKQEHKKEQEGEADDISNNLSLRNSRNKSVFGDCALVEIIHLHDCLRGAITALQRDVEQLCKLSTNSVVYIQNSSISDPETMRRQQELSEVERRLVGRFKVIWSVFRAHSAAEDEFIWPALKEKTTDLKMNCNLGIACCNTEKSAPSSTTCNRSQNVIVQQEYEDDHADEEQMFMKMDEMLSKIRSELFRNDESQQQQQQHLMFNNNSAPVVDGVFSEMTADLQIMVSQMSNHLFRHLEKEEVQCLPLVAKYMSKEEINELVGKIMGRRSSDMMCKILTMAVQTLPKSEREEMIENMKQAMVGTFFERWLVMEGFGTTISAGSNTSTTATTTTATMAAASSVCNNMTDNSTLPTAPTAEAQDENSPLHDDSHSCLTSSICSLAGKCVFDMNNSTTIEQKDLEKLIKTIAANPNMTLVEKNASIQHLRDSIWKNNRKRKYSMEQQESSSSSSLLQTQDRVASQQKQQLQSSMSFSTKGPRVTPPAAYYRRTNNGVELLWSSESSSSFPLDGSIPLFSAAELAPTYHNGAAGAVLGCPHYARSVKKRHPESGRLYTCRLCCEQDRERPLKDHDSPLDRYKVTEVLCMRCGVLQPADKQCVNPKCESKGKPFARYYCKICNLYDDSPHKKIYHCPFCNVCRSGAGLGIDYRHCMRCNACVSLSANSTSNSSCVNNNNNNHVCIPHCLQGNCPICHESMFESTKPLRGLKCGHVMHLSCFTMYIRAQTYTCPLCKKSVEDMREYFSQLDAAIWMQPMPAAYSATMSKIYCQDCSSTCVVKYHFVGCKCTSCGSYNTREVERIAGQSS